MKSNRLHRTAFTLVEAVMAMLIVSLLVVSSMRAAGASGLVQYKSAELATGRLLANGLMQDILIQNYEEPSGSPVFGLESGESSTSKGAWDDVDDFNGWTESPPQERDGTVMTGMGSWSRSVVVERISTTDLTQTSSTETGAKRITVTVQHNKVLVTTRVAVRTKAP